MVNSLFDANVHFALFLRCWSSVFSRSRRDVVVGAVRVHDG